MVCVNLNKCIQVDATAVDKLKKKVIWEFYKLLCLTEKGRKPNYQFIMEEIGLIGLSSENSIDNIIFMLQFYLNNKWQTS